jgi:hypothetical protein
MISDQDMQVVEEVLGMKLGYVLDFSNRTFATFFRDQFDLDIESDIYHTEGSSKANRLRSLLRHGPSSLVGKVLVRLLEHRSKVQHLTDEPLLLSRYQEIILALEDSNDLEKVGVANDGLSLRKAISGAKVVLTSSTTREQAHPKTVAEALGKTHVLAIGISNYSTSSNFSGLRQCTFDAQAIAACFRDRIELGSQNNVHELASRSSSSRGRIMEAVRNLAAQATEDDRVIIFFSGHGQRLNEKLYAVPEDAWCDDDPGALICMEDLFEIISNSEARIKIVILDACFTGPDLSTLNPSVA